MGAGALAAQVYEIPAPDPVAQARARLELRRVEAKLVRGLARSHGDPALGTRFGEAIRGIAISRLDHPSPAVRAAIEAARDPAALALAIAGDAGGLVDDPVTYETDVLLTALALPSSAPRRAELWAKAAEVVRRSDDLLRLACLERAAESLAQAPGGSRAGAPPDAFAIASLRLDGLLGAGLAGEAVATFDALPADLRERLLAAPGGTTVDGYIRPDQRLSLAAARLLTGDESGARALLARTPVAAWHPADGNLTDASQRDPMAVFRAVLERSLAPAANDDAFPLLAEFAATDLFGPSTAVWGAGITAYARLAEREGYPAFAAFAWRMAPGDANPPPPEPALLPAAAAKTLRRLRAAAAEQARLASAAMLANYRAAGEHPRPPALSARDGSRLDQAPYVQLFVLDRAGRLGLVLIDHPPFYGELYRLQPREPGQPGLVGVLFGSWIS